jgi:hypothetical protein
MRNFQVHGVPPGSYTLFSTDRLDDVWGRMDIDISHDVHGIRLAPQPGFPVSGRFVVADSSLRPTGSVSLALVPEGVASRTVATDSSGAFTIPGVIAGIWKPLVSRIPPGLALIDVRQQGRSVYDDGFRLDGPGTYPLQVLLGPAANLEGTVLDSSQQSVVNARVLVRPAAPNESRTVLFREATTDSAGHFMIEGMAAGDYIVTLSGETEGVAVTLRVDRGNKVALTLSQK